MFRAFAASMSGLLFGVTYPALGAEPLAKSGSFTIHSGWKSIGETTQIADGRTLGSGSFWGVTFNDKGSGPLHSGPVLCPYTLEILNGTLTARGQCSWSDLDGDKFFTDSNGSLPSNGQFDGMNQITGGTGKYAGIQGRAPFHCRPLNGSGQWACTQQFEYRLP
jgi:hypothetical protein